VRAQLVLAALSGLMAVAAGAFGAHAAADPQAKSWLQTGAQYQIVHALAVFACLAVQRAHPAQAAGWAAWLFLAGGLIFGGSLYLMALTGVRALGAVTPIGGLLLMGGWAALAWAAWTGSRA
jgi:uncharacterized membrane protein YgdD (TMEM256/DUF423 family)